METSAVNDVVADFCHRVHERDNYKPWMVIGGHGDYPCPENGYELQVDTPEKIAHWKLTLSEFALYAYAVAPDYIWAQRCLILFAYILRSMTVRNQNYARELLRKYYEPRLRTVPIE